jgi:hypothetical protein
MSDNLRPLDVLGDVDQYSDVQLQHAMSVAFALENFYPAHPASGTEGRGLFVYCIPPDKPNPGRRG